MCCAGRASGGRVAAAGEWQVYLVLRQAIMVCLLFADGSAESWHYESVAQGVKVLDPVGSSLPWHGHSTVLIATQGAFSGALLTWQC